MDIALYNEDLKEVAYVKTEAQAEILKESGWSKATKAQVDKHEAKLEKAEGGEQ